MGQTFCLRLKTLFIGLGSMPYIYPAKTVLDIKVHGSQKLEIFACTFFETKLELSVCTTALFWQEEVVLFMIIRP